MFVKLEDWHGILERAAGLLRPAEKASSTSATKSEKPESSRILHYKKLGKKPASGLLQSAFEMLVMRLELR